MELRWKQEGDVWLLVRSDGGRLDLGKLCRLRNGPDLDMWRVESRRSEGEEWRTVSVHQQKAPSPVESLQRRGIWLIHRLAIDLEAEAKAMGWEDERWQLLCECAAAASQVGDEKALQYALVIAVDLGLGQDGDDILALAATTEHRRQARALLVRMRSQG